MRSLKEYVGAKDEIWEFYKIVESMYIDIRIKICRKYEGACEDLSSLCVSVRCKFL
jgi:hypothetical protein